MSCWAVRSGVETSHEGQGNTAAALVVRSFDYALRAPLRMTGQAGNQDTPEKTATPPENFLPRRIAGLASFSIFAPDLLIILIYD